MTPATDEHADRVMGAATRLRRRLSSEAGFDLRERLQASVRTIGGHTSVTPAVTGRAGMDRARRRDGPRGAADQHRPGDDHPGIWPLIAAVATPMATVLLAPVRPSRISAGLACGHLRLRRLRRSVRGRRPCGRAQFRPLARPRWLAAPRPRSLSNQRIGCPAASITSTNSARRRFNPCPRHVVDRQSSCLSYHSRV